MEMIIDKLENIRQYLALNRGFLKAVEFLSNPDLIALQENRYEIDGDRVYAMVSKDSGRNIKDAHMPLISDGRIHKVVVKIAEDLE